MSLKNPPIQDSPISEDGFFKKTWLDWFRSVTRGSKEGFTGSFMNGDGDTVTVVDGKITDVS